jgi:hypothetical protein
MYIKIVFFEKIVIPVYFFAHEFHVNGACRAVVDASQAGDARIRIDTVIFKIDGANRAFLQARAAPYAF